MPNINDYPVKKYVLTPALLLMVFWAFVSQAHAWYPYSEKYNKWQADRPFLMAGLHNSVPKDKLDLRVQRFKAAGLNTITWAKPWAAMHFFREANRQGLQWACWFRDNPDAVRRAMEIPGNSFIISGDEPSTEEEILKYGEHAAWVRQNYPDTIQFLNLFINSFDHDRAMEVCQSDVFSFDHYPLQRDGTTLDTYLYNLNWGRQTAMRYKVPYWIWLQALGAEPSSNRIPDQADLRFLVYTFLAHGGTGIQFYLYYGHDESVVIDTGVENMARKTGNERYENTIVTRTWFAIRDVAPEVQNLGHVLVNLRSKDEIVYTGNGDLWDILTPNYPHNPKVPLKHGKFKGHEKLKGVEVVEGTDRGFLIGFFDDEAGEEYFMVVNLMHGANMSKMDGRREVILRFSAEVENIERLNRFSGNVETLETKQAGKDYRKLHVHLEGGTGDLFKWSNGKPWAMR